MSQQDAGGMNSREELRHLADRLRWISNERVISLKLAQEVCEKLPAIIEGLETAIAKLADETSP